MAVTRRKIIRIIVLTLILLGLVMYFGYVAPLGKQSTIQPDTHSETTADVPITSHVNIEPLEEKTVAAPITTSNIEPVEETVAAPITTSNIETVEAPIVEIPDEVIVKPDVILESTPAFKYPDECLPFFDSSSANVSIQSSEDLFPSERPTQSIPEIIHFLSYNPDLRTARYICSLESALMNNPNHIVNLYTPDPDTMKGELKKWTESMGRDADNLRIVKMDYPAVFKDTPMENWYGNETYKKSHWIKQNL